MGGFAGRLVTQAAIAGAVIVAMAAWVSGAAGAYSTPAQWATITGGTTSSSGSLYQIPDWVPGARTLSGAKANCGLASFTAGRVAITQWSGRPDHDYAC